MSANLTPRYNGIVALGISQRHHEAVDSVFIAQFPAISLHSHIYICVSN